MRDIKAIIPKKVAVLDGENRLVDMLDLFELIEEIQEAAEERRGDKGDTGECGPPGKDGRDGKDGAQGKPGERGPAGPAGKDGVDGKDGRNGADGLPGKPGERGPAGPTPEHEVDLANPGVRFKRPDGTWGAWIRPPAGKNGRGGGSSWAGSAEFDAKVREIASEVGGSSTPQVYAGPQAPVVATGTAYIWWETGLGNGSGFTLWFEDGT